MTGEDIVNRVKTLDLPQGEYVVFGSCPMALACIRESGDIDMLVSPELRAQLAEKGWKEVDKGGTDRPLTHDVFEAHDKWDFSSYQPTLNQLLATATLVDGVPFASLEDVKKWKTSSGRPKDLKDIKLINDYLAGKTD